MPASDAPPADAAEPAEPGDGAAGSDGGPSETTTGPAPPPAPHPRPPIYRRHQLAGVAGAAAAITALSLLVDSAFGYGLVHSWLVFSILGLGFYLVFGVSGQFAFSQGAFFGLGAYASVWASDGRSFAWGLVAAIAVTAVVALAFALVVVRSDHFYFAIATLAFSHIALVVFREFEAFTAPGGEIVGIPKPDLFGHSFDTGRSLALFLGAFLVLGLLGVALVERSPLRREAIAFRDNREVAATLGVPVLRLRLGMFVLGSTYAGVAGCLFAHRSGFVSPESFALQLGIDIFLIVLLGGVGSMWGPVLGAAFVVWAPEQLRFVDEYRSLIYGALLVAVIVAFPKGLVGVVELVWGRVRRRPGVPAAAAGERA